jgi:Uma2 family endonuclease
MKALIKWSIEDYHRMIETGILDSRPCELLEGEIVAVSPEKPLHREVTDTVAEYLRDKLRGIAKVYEAHPITLSDSELEPDVAIVKLPVSNYHSRHPYPEDIYWLIEIANTTLNIDLKEKQQVYARAKITEYWVINLIAKKIIIFRQPEGNKYKNHQELSTGIINPLAFQEVKIDVENLLTWE